MAEGMTLEEAQLIGKMNVMLENKLSSVKITSKVEMKTGIRHVEWEVKAKHADVNKALEASKLVDDDLRRTYASK